MHFLLILHCIDMLEGNKESMKFIQIFKNIL